MSSKLYCARDELGRAPTISVAPSAIAIAFITKFLSKLITAVAPSINAEEQEVVVAE